MTVLDLWYSLLERLITLMNLFDENDVSVAIIIIFIRGRLDPPVTLLLVYMHKLGRSKHEIYYKLLVFLTYHWSCYFGVKVIK